MVDNLNGAIVVSGYAGKSVELTARHTIRASDRKGVEQAKKEVFLNIEEDDHNIVLFVESPCRRRDGSVSYRGRPHDGYEVRFDFELKVPADVDIDLSTVNDGNISVRDMKGNFHIDNINGGVTFRGAGGAGRVYALNGDVKVEFSRNPQQDCYFGSLNGEVEISFLHNLEADLRFKTFNGDIFTDFEVVYLRPRKPEKRREGGRFVYRADKFFGVRIGEGGPQLEFDSFNGDIYVAKR